MTNQKWTLETIRNGVERFINESQRMPTATDFDHTEYLPTSRQIQRIYGGMSTLRETLGYGKLDFTKGKERTAISTKASLDGIAAEEYLEAILIKQFGESFVHTQKRYSFGTKNRFDFFIYAQNVCFGVDVFTTGRQEYISTNVRHKIKKYKDFNVSVPIFFVVLGGNYSIQDITHASDSVKELRSHKNIQLVNESQFLSYTGNQHALNTPEAFIGIL
jgi:hypothetical protein